jgi:hypothetical protein
VPGRVGACAAFILLLARLVTGQESQFFFDANGNFLIQTTAVTAPPQILGQPQSRIVGPDEVAAFSVVAASTRSLAYQWRFNGTNIFGATNDALLLHNVNTNHEGEYRVVLTNPSGLVTSAPAYLMIDSDADGISDSWEMAHFGNLSQVASADADGDGSSNLQEFQNDSDPTDANSVYFRLLVLRDGGSVIKTLDRTSYTNGELVTLTAVSAPGAEPFHGWLGDIVTRSNPVTVVMTNNKTIYARFTPIVFTWTNLASGDWNTATNWTPNLAPGSNDTVVITSDVTVTLNTPADCADLTLGSLGSNPTLTANGPLTVRGNFLWISGTMTGSGRTILEPGATLELANPGSGVFSLNGHTIENGGTILCSGAGGLGLNFGAVLTNRSGGLFDVRTAAGLSTSFGVNRFDNTGIFRKSANTGIATVGSSFNGSRLSFNNYGVVEIETGTLNLAGGGTHTASSSMTGAGHITFSGGTVNLAGLINVSGSNTFSGGTANLTGNYICTNNTLTISGNGVTANFSGTGEVSPAVLHLKDSATLSGTSVVTVRTAMNWTEGSMTGSGRTIIFPGAMGAINSPFGIEFSLMGRTLENGGTLVWSGAGSLGLFSGAVITNRPGGLFQVENAKGVGTIPGPGRFDNAGTFRKSVSTGTTTFASGVPFNNFGMVDLRSGILAANGGYVSSTNALLNCALGGTTAGTNYGQLQVAGTVSLNGNLSVDLLPGFSPALNDSFTVLTAGTRNGAFAGFFYPSNAVSMHLSNTPTSVVLRITNVFAAFPAPMLFLPELIGSNINIRWAAVSNVMYRLEFNPDLGNLTNWNPVPGDVTTTSNTASKLDALTSSNRLYRVRVLP